MHPVTDSHKELLRLVHSISPSHSRWKVFEDFTATEVTKRLE